nr:hypothetical protein [Marinicella sp. W31]MDC2877192.1 hypothetical protein [Marinicella sp. W31]
MPAELLKGCKQHEDHAWRDAGLMKELKIRLLKRMVTTELAAHLGYADGKIPRLISRVTDVVLDEVQEWLAARNPFTIMCKDHFYA